MESKKAMLALLPAAALSIGLQAAAPALTAGAQSQGQSPTGYEPGMHFSSYYKNHDGMRLLGYAVSDESLLPDSSATPRVNIPIQYFQKGRIEYHGNMGETGAWEYMYGLLVPEMIDMATKANDVAISNTSISYGQLKALTDPSGRVNPPAGFKGGTQRSTDGRYEFIPQSPSLAPAPGFMIPTYFWNYMNSGVFPAGWLHDLGLPISVPFQGTVMKNEAERGVSMQAFERGVLTYDPRNPANFKVERANIGADYAFMTKQAGQLEQNAIPNAQNIVRTFWRSLDEKNYAAAYEMLAGSYKAMISLDQFSKQMAGAVEHATNVQFTESQELPNLSIQLTVKVDIQTGAQPTNYSNGTNVVYTTLINENGAWRISNMGSGPTADEGGNGGQSGGLLTLQAQTAVNYWQAIDEGRVAAPLRCLSAEDRRLRDLPRPDGSRYRPREPGEGSQREGAGRRLDGTDR